MRLRQIALAARDLEGTTDVLRDVLGLEPGFHDPGVGTFGLVNEVFAVGDTFLEVVSPDREGTTAGRWIERRGGDAGYMVILQARDLAAERARIEATGARIAWEIETDEASTLHVHPRDVGGAIVSFDVMDRFENWHWAGPDWRDRVRGDVCGSITGAHIEDGDPDARCRRWADVIGVEPGRDDAGRPVIVLPEGGTLRFVAAEGDGGPALVGIELELRDVGHFEERAEKRGVRGADGVVRVGGLALLPAPA